MKKTFKTIIYIILTLILIICMSSCGKKNDSSYQNYSYGLCEDGYYENLDNNKIDLPDYSNVKYTVNEILDWSAKTLHDQGSEDIETVDDYVYLYGKEFLASLGLGKKDVVEDTDIVSATLEFSIDGKIIDDYSSTKNYQADVKGDAIIKSFIGHKNNDSYEIDYVFPKDEKDYANKKAKVKITINSILVEDPLKTEDIVKNNLAKINETIEGTTDVKSFLKNLRPKIAEARLPEYIQEKVQSDNSIKVPKEYVKYELHRLNARLKKLNYDYDRYLKESKLTDADVKLYCEMIARENLVFMTICKNAKISVTDKDIVSCYGSSKEQVKKVQGEAYMKTSIIRQYGTKELINKITLIDDDGNSINVDYTTVLNTDDDKDTISSEADN